MVTDLRSVRPQPECRKKGNNLQYLLNYFFIFLVFSACSGLEKSEKERLRKQNAKGEYIYRRKYDHLYSQQEPKPQERARYPWEQENNTYSQK